MQETLKIFKRILRFLFFLGISCSLLALLYFFFVLATFIFLFYQLLLVIIVFLIVSLLIILIRRSRYRLRRYGLGILIGLTILYGCFLAIPEFNFFITFNTRQQIVNQYFQQNIKVENSWLGEVNYFPNSVYFTYFKAPHRFGSRVFFVYQTTSPFDPRETVTKLKKNWYFVEGQYAS
jgi:hypothetical protein